MSLFKKALQMGRGSKGGAKKSGGKAAAATSGGSSGKQDAWQGLRGSANVTPTAKASIDDIVASASNAQGMPDRNVLSDMLNKAGKLSYKGSGKGKYGEDLKGIQFHVAEYSTQGGKESAKKTLYNEFVSHKSDSGVCYENTILPMPRGGAGHIIIHQSLAPCTNCCNGYKAWAKREGCTIVIAYDRGYDGSGGDGWYVFAGDGECFGYKP